MPEIALSGGAGNGLFALVDDADFERISSHRWCLHSDGYAVRGVRDEGRSITILMHREVLGLGPASRATREVVDHTNQNRLDNRRTNLRLVDRSQNGQNSSKSRGRSRFRNVSFDSYTRRWRAVVTADGVTTRLGRFDTEEEAAVAVVEFKARKAVTS